jgi:glycosyltransferase involved in cell wall biosynthesis
LHIAFVGSVKPHKGALVFEQVVGLVEAAAPGAVRWSVYGGGDVDLLTRLRRLPRVRVRGYYRSGSLPRLLAADGVDLALLLSIVPESYGLTLSECRAAGVPVVAFDLGALADRLRAGGDGLLVPLAAGAGGVAEAISDLLAGRVPAAVPRSGLANTL